MRDEEEPDDHKQDAGDRLALPPRGDRMVERDAARLNEGFEVAAAKMPACPPSSGDFYAAFPLEEGKVGIVMGDVVGHGPEAAGHADQLKDAIAGVMQEGLPPDEALNFVNAAAEMRPEFQGFATVFAGTVDAQGTIVYASGGHEPALLTPGQQQPEQSGGESAAVAGASGDHIEELIPTGPPLGVMGTDEFRHQSETARMGEGATLLLYTDGVTEARDGRRGFLGVGRMRLWLARFLTLRPDALILKLIRYVWRHSRRGETLRDDAALLALKRLPAEEAAALDGTPAPERP